MTNQPLNILCTGDIHLGRHPTRIPPHIDGPRFSPRAIWDTIVDHAIQHDTDALIVTGDIVDRENRYYEAYGPIEAAAHRLNDAHIPLITVAGNHDYDGLPHLINELDLPNVHLLGEDGTWEEHTIHDANDEPILHLHGWSFPTQHVHQSPLDDYDLDPHPTTPTIGILHTDLDANEDRYAPTTTQQLRETHTDAWILGHIHAPSVRHQDDPLIIYPGSPQPLSPNEPGTHGPWHITLQTDATPTAKQHPLATVRYEHITTPADQTRNAKDIPRIITETLRETLQDKLATHNPDLLLPRISLQGRSPAHAQLRQEREALEDQLAGNLDGIPYHVEKLTIDTRPAIDLDTLGDDDTPPGYLARLLQAIENDDPSKQNRALIQDALEAMHTARDANAYTELRKEQRAPTPTREDAIRELRRQAATLLDVLLDQKEASP